MKKSTKKKILILAMSLALVAGNFALFSTLDANNSTGKSSQQTVSGKTTEKKAEKHVAGTEENLEAVNDKLIVTDADGNEISLAEVEKENYKGFVYKLSTDEGGIHVADSLEEISKMASADSIEYIEPNYKAELLFEEEPATDENASAEKSDGEESKAEDADDTQGISTTTEDNEMSDASENEAKLDYTPNDTYYEEYCKWYQNMVKLPAVWDKGVFGSSQVTVAVIDSGVDYNHKDLNKDNILKGKYYVSGSSGDGAQDHYWHGTFVIGLIAAIMNNNEGVAGAMPNVKILPIKVFDSTDGTSTTGGYISDISDAVIYAADNNADVISMSLGIRYSAPKSLDDACQYAVSKGAIIVAAAGNDYSSTKNYPASFENVISVGAVDSEQDRSSFSNYNDAVDVVAAGSGITGLKIGGGYYASKSGTSFSTPQVAAMAAMVKSIDKDCTAQDFEEIVKETSVDIGTKGRDNSYGYGLADFDAAYQCVINRDSISGYTVTVDETNNVYNGTAHTPKITVTKENGAKGTETLKLNTDYEIVSWSNNVNAGTASVTIQGINNYYGKVSKDFTILKATPKYIAPGTEVTAYCGQTLSTVKLPSEYKWNNPGNKTLGMIGATGDYEVMYQKNNDTVNYNPVAGKITVNVSKHNHKLQHNSTQHWGQCVCGDITGTADHGPGTVAGAYSSGCTSWGYTGDTYCSVCGEYMYGGSYTAPHGHAVVKVGKINPTCCSVGYKAHYACPYCGLCYKDKKGKKTCSLSKYKIKKKSHSYTKKIVAPQYLKKAATKKSAAIYYKSCKWCGKRGKSTFKYGKKLS